MQSSSQMCVLIYVWKYVEILYEPKIEELTHIKNIWILRVMNI